MGRISQISTTVQAIRRFVVSQWLPEAADHSGPQRPYGCETKFTSRTKHHVTIISKNYVTKLLCLFGYCKFTSTTMSIYLCEKMSNHLCQNSSLERHPQPDRDSRITFKCTACITFKCTATDRTCSGIQCYTLVTKNAVLLLPILLYSCFRKRCTVVTKRSETTNLQAKTLYTERSAYLWIPPRR